MAEIRLHLDESVAVAVVAPLRARSINVTTSAEADLIGASDEEQLALATGEGRVLITHDDDFVRLHHLGAEHAGIGYCHQTKYSVGDLLQVLILLHGCISAEDMINRVEYLSHRY